MVSPNSGWQSTKNRTSFHSLHDLIHFSGWTILVCNIVILLWAAGQLGGNYGGVIWYYSSLDTLPEVYQTRFPPQVGVYKVSPLQVDPQGDATLSLLPNDTLLAVNGQAPSELWNIYQNQPIGQVITFDVARDGVILQIPAKVSHFALGALVRCYLLFSLAIFSTLFAAWKALEIDRPYATSLSILLLVAAFLILAFLLHFSGVTSPPLWDRRSWYVVHAIGLLIAAYAIVYFGATLTDNSGNLHLIQGGWWLALLLSGGYMGWMVWAVWTLDAPLADHLYIGALSLFAVSFLVNLLFLYKRPFSLSIQYQSLQSARNILILWLFTALFTIGFWVAPRALGQQTLLSFESWAIFVTIDALGLYFVIRNEANTEQLLHEVSLRMEYLRQLETLQSEQSRALRQIEESIHDRVLANLKGAHMVTLGVERRLVLKNEETLSSELREVAKVLQEIGQETRKILQGTQTNDWSNLGLRTACSALLEQFCTYNPAINVIADLSLFDDQEPAFVKERLYLILRSALNNIREHAQAKTVTITLKTEKGRTILQILDDGVGFELPSLPENQSGITHLGLRMMRLGAADIGADFQIRTAPTLGTEITVTCKPKF